MLEMVNFVCMECGYKFETEGHKPKNCPYCNKKSVEKERSAEELVDSVSLD